MESADLPRLMGATSGVLVLRDTPWMGRQNPGSGERLHTWQSARAIQCLGCYLFYQQRYQYLCRRRLCGQHRPAQMHGRRDVPDDRVQHVSRRRPGRRVGGACRDTQITAAGTVRPAVCAMAGLTTWNHPGMGRRDEATGRIRLVLSPPPPSRRESRCHRAPVVAPSFQDLQPLEDSFVTPTPTGGQDDNRPRVSSQFVRAHPRGQAQGHAPTPDY